MLWDGGRGAGTTTTRGVIVWQRWIVMNDSAVGTLVQGRLMPNVVCRSRSASSAATRHDWRLCCIEEAVVRQPYSRPRAGPLCPQKGPLAPQGASWLTRRLPGRPSWTSSRPSEMFWHTEIAPTKMSTAGIKKWHSQSRPGTARALCHTDPPPLPLVTRLPAYGKNRCLTLTRGEFAWKRTAGRQEQ